MTSASSISGSNPYCTEPGEEAFALEILNTLRESEPTVNFVLDQESRRFLHLSGPCEDFFNLTLEQVLADPDAWSKSVDALDRAATDTLQQDLKRHGRAVRILHATGRDGVRRLLRAALVLQHVRGRPFVSGSVLEVSPDRFHHGETSVLRSAVEEAHEGIAVTDKEGCYLYLNREHVALFGYESMEELIGKSWRIFYTDRVVRQIEQTVFPELLTKGCWRGQLQAKRKDGSLFCEALSLSLLSNGGIVCNCQDVSAQVRLAEQLERSEALFRAFLNTLPTAVTIRNLTGEYEFVNLATSTFLGLENGFRGKPLKMDLCLGDARVFAYWGAVDQRVANTGTAVRFDFPLSWGNREWVLDVEKLPLRIGSSEVTHVCTLVHDVTVARKREAESADVARRRDEYLVMQREFISMVSHEFRTPLTAIQGLHDLMVKNSSDATGPSAGRFTRWLDLEGRALAALSHLVNQVLLLNRIEHLESAVPHKVRLLALLEKILEGIAATLEPPRLSVKLDLPAEFSAMVHEPQIRALVENLVSNGLKYSTEIVTVQAGVDEDHWWLAVIDLGRGIPEKDQANITQPFYRASNTGNVAGTGLGLTIVQRCVTFHGGKLLVESRPGAGSNFTVRIPLGFPVPPTAESITDPVASADLPIQLVTPL